MIPYTLIAIVGLLSIIVGTSLVSSSLKVRRRYTYPLLILGGVCLLVYSIHLNDLIFIILQSVFIVSSIVGLIRINERRMR
jgi:lipid-A-disaccharide synthase-like uncharacterized protein